MKPDTDPLSPLSIRTLQAGTEPIALNEDAPDASHLAGLNERQREAVLASPDQPLQVLAGAGTGKTELISRRFVQLVREFRARGVARPVDRILVVTFTTDAAAAMRARIHQRLVEHGEEDLGPGAWIGTFHQTCMRLLRHHPLEAGLPPDFAVFNPLEQESLFKQLMERVLTGQCADLTPIFRQVGLTMGASADLPPDVLSLPRLRESRLGALNGDLDDLLDPDRVFRLINRIKTAGLSPADFRATAIRQSEAFTRRLTGLPIPHDKSLNKADNVCLKLAAWRDALAPWAFPGWDPIRDAERKAERNGGNATPSLYKNQLPGLAGLYLAPRSFEPLTPDHAWAEAALESEKALIDILTGIYALYQDALLAHGACDFDDLTNHAARLLSRPHIGERYREHFEAVIVDEFQDSNGSQLHLLERLTRPRAANLTVVGDEKQSIYAFRFAQPENLDLVFRHAPARRVNLQTNYRSRPPILHAANHLTDLLTERPDSHLHPPAREGDRLPLPEFPRVTGVRLDAPVPTDTQDPTAETSTGKHRPIAEQKEREARFIAVEIARLVREEAILFSDVAVLVKSHGKAEAIQRVLREYGIPSVRQKSLGFFREPVIKDAMALMRLVRHPADDASLVRLLQGRLNQRQIRDLLGWKRFLAESEQKPVSLLEACLQPPASLGEPYGCGSPPESLGLQATPDTSSSLSEPVVDAVSDLARRLRTAHAGRFRQPVAGIFRSLARVLGLIDIRLPEWRRKEDRIRLRTFEKLLHAISLTTRRIGQPPPAFEEVMDRLEGYAANPRLDLPVSEDPGNEDAVRIMTIYAAKGLEFPVVFAACTEQGRVSRGGDDAAILFDPQYEGKNGFGLILGNVDGQPNLKREVYRKCWLEPRAAREEQRVFYVALTRAKERLYIIRSSQSFPWTDPDDYPHRAIRVLSETRDAELLETRYWQADPEAIRREMEILQESRKSRMRGEMGEGAVSPDA
jgi:superfamily I DNA/RNA helicase